MKRIVTISTISLTILVIAVLLFFKTNKLGDTIFRRTQIKDTTLLRTEILKTIKIPFAKTDTLIIETVWKICGNSTEDELPIVFDTKLEDHPYIDNLSKNLGLTVVTMTDFNKVMDTVLKYKFHGNYPESLWDTCRRNKIHASIRTEKSKQNGNILVHEQYLFADTLKSFDKEFYVGNNGKWLYKINQSHVDTLKSGR
jgi:hypothetical protein